MRIYGSKKATVTGVGVVLIPTMATLITTILNQYNVDPGTIQSIVEAMAWAMGVILAGYNIGQGVADHGKGVAKYRDEEQGR